MTDWTGNGATLRTETLAIPVLPGLRCSPPARHAAIRQILLFHPADIPDPASSHRRAKPSAARQRLPRPRRGPESTRKPVTQRGRPQSPLITHRYIYFAGTLARRVHAVRRPAHLLSGIARCPKCRRGLHYRNHKGGRAESYACVKGAAGCGGVAIKADLLEEYVTGAVLDALESPRVQDALREGEDHHAPRRAELLEQIRDAQERRDEARRDYSDRVIDRADWLDIRHRTEDEISRARREYDRLTGSATVLGDIPPAERVRDAWESWTTNRRRAAIRAVLHRVIINPLPPGAACNVAGNAKDKAVRREREMTILRQRVEFDWRI